jgi:hypothetical protein
MLIKLIQANYIILQFRRDKVIIPIINHRVVDSQVMVHMVVLGEILQGG